MPVKKKPDGYHTITPYLVVGDAEKVIDFAKWAFDAVERSRHLDDEGRIMHAEFTIGDSAVMIGTASEEWPANQTMLHLYVDDADAAFERALTAGAQPIRKVQDEFYGDRSGGVELGGVTWWLATHVEDVSPEEMERRSREAAAQSAR